MFVALTLASARAAELVMFEQAGCPWCTAFDRDIGTIYGKTEDGLRAPLRRVDINQALPADLKFIQVERLTPLFVLVDKGGEIGRIRGYGGREMFWTQLYMLMQKLGAARTGGEHDVPVISIDCLTGNDLFGIGSFAEAAFHAP